MSSILALDIGESRIGIAVASHIARLPSPLTTLENNEKFIGRLHDLITTESADLVVIGLPRSLSGQDTAQTEYVRGFARAITEVPVVFQDEALTSQKAEAELIKRGKPYRKGDIDALAATYILDDYLMQMPAAAS